MVPLVQLAHAAHKEKQDALDSPDKRVTKAILAAKVTLAELAPRALEASLVKREDLANLVVTETLAIKASEVSPAFKDPLAQLEDQAPLDPRATKVLLVSRAALETQDRLVLVDRKAHKD